MGRSSAKSHSSLWKCTPKKYSRQTAFGFWSILCKKSRQRPEMYPEKTFRPDNLRLPFPTDREAPQATRCDNPKKYSSRQLSAFGQFSVKSLASLRNCALKRRSGQAASSFGEILCKKPLQRSEIYPEKVQLQTVFGFWSIPCKKSRQPSEIYPGKMFTPVRFRLPFSTDREAPQVARCDNSKKYSSRLPSAFG